MKTHNIQLNPEDRDNILFISLLSNLNSLVLDLWDFFVLANMPHRETFP